MPSTRKGSRRAHNTPRTNKSGSRGRDDQPDLPVLREEPSLDVAAPSASNPEDGPTSRAREVPSMATQRSTRGNDRPPSSSSSVVSSIARKRKLELSAAEERARIRKKMLEEREKIELELVNSRLAAELAQIDAESIRSNEDRQNETSCAGDHSSSRNVQEWLNNPVTHPEPIPADNPEPVPASTRLQSEPKSDELIEIMRALTQTIEAVRESSTSANAANRCINRFTNFKELPIFSGDSLDWLRFKRAFDLSNELGGYTDQENVARLYNCLRGEAKEAVDSLMVTSTNAAQIIETLSLRFGNSDLILRKIVHDIRKLPKLSTGRIDIITLATKVKNSVAAMETMNHIGYLHSPELAADIVSKMTTPMIHHYNRFLHGNTVDEPRLVTISKFLFLEAEMACKAGTSTWTDAAQGKPYESRIIKATARHRDFSAPDKQSNINRGQRTAVYTAVADPKNNASREVSVTKSAKRPSMECSYCGNRNHLVTKCGRFLSTPVKSRWQWAKGQGMCFRCLVEKHNRKRCSARTCQKDGCHRPHHNLLHSDNQPVTTTLGRVNIEESTVKDKMGPSTVTTANIWLGHERMILLKVLPVVLSGPNGRVETYALLDEGSTTTLVDSKIAQRIGVTGPRDPLSVRGISETVTTDTRSEAVTVVISDKKGGPLYTIKNARTINSLSLPRQILRAENVKKYPHLKDIELDLYSDAEVKILIGQDNWDLIVSREIRSARRNVPVASRTKLGWVVHGYMPARSRKEIKSTVALGVDDENASAPMLDPDTELNELVKSSFQLDAIGVNFHKRKNTLNKRAEQILETTTRRVGNRWETGLLWKDDTSTMPDNRKTAEIRLKSLEKKIDSDSTYRQLYLQQIQKFIDCGYAKKVDVVQESQRVWYLPHFGVVNANKPGKLRLVFDAAAKTQGISLNDKLLTGPDMLNSLLGVLMRFRQRAIAVNGDIKDMFLQIKIKPSDQYAQLFLWRGENREGEPDTYCMTSMIFGATSSPSTAIYVKDRNAREFESKYPSAVAAILNKHYMDDYLDSMDTEEEAIERIKQVAYIHKCGGFEMRGWASNSPMVMKNVPKEDLAPGDIKLSLNDSLNSVERILGLKWDSCTDTLGFEINLKKIPVEIMTGSRKPTKREMLRVIMSVFDPLGLLTPFTIRSKILLQSVWRSGIGWDEQLSEKDSQKWQKWREDLNKVSQIVVPRCYTTRKRTTKIVLHTFCDASEQAFAAVSYWVFQFDNGYKCTAFIAGKSRVAPLKPLSIPRMELQAAVLASRLAHTIGNEHEFKAFKRVFWSDSCTVLQWIRSDPRSYKTFVSHRLGEIDELTEVAEWKWVPTSKNPADLATRDESINLAADSKWFRGPSFLNGEETAWPQEPAKPRNQQLAGAEEERALVVAVQWENHDYCVPNVKRFSSWRRLVRSTAWVLCFVDRCRKLSSGTLSNDHMQRAEQLLAKTAQRESFMQDISALQRHGTVPTDSRLRHLTPVLDIHGVLRVQGRLSNYQGIDEEQRSPIILDGRHAYTRLLILHYHQRAGHQSPEIVINEIRQRYWVVNLRPTVRSVTRECQMCRIRQTRPEPPRMADLPSPRLSHHRRPFTFCGIDYFGPMNVTVGRRHEKRWGVLFTCLSTRAIHLELANSLTTDSTILALRRLAARRGCPSEIYSDNGTNLRGADVELRTAITELDQKKQQQYGTCCGIAWHFLPPASPHMGGSWERLVGCVKKALKIILKERAPPEEVLATLLVEAEHMVNSRPLTHVSVDHRDQEALTPNHFLIGSSSGVATQGKFTDEDLVSRKRWRTAQRLADLFWNRWLREYLPTLHPRRKWSRDTQQLKLNDVVIIADHTLPRNCWLKGIITQVFPGKDGRVRVAEIRTVKGILRRPAVKIIRLAI